MIYTLISIEFRHVTYRHNDGGQRDVRFGELNICRKNIIATLLENIARTLTDSNFTGMLNFS